MLEYGRKLKVFLVQKGVKQKEFAERIGAHPTTVCDSWIRKNMKPHIRFAHRINEYTNNEISMQEMGW